MAKAKTAKAVKAAKVPETVYISEADQYLFAQGTHYDIYKKLGAHQSVEDGKKGMSFAVWAPHAASVFVIGTFNSWKSWDPAEFIRRLFRTLVWESFTNF